MGFAIPKHKYEHAKVVGKYTLVGMICFGAFGWLLTGTVSGVAWLAFAICLFFFIFYAAFGVVAGTLLGTERTRSPSPTPSGPIRDGSDAGHLQYQCEACGTVLSDWEINEFGSDYTCGECGHVLHNQQAAHKKVHDGWAWDEEEGLA
jgi:DNA-directed RNA polymerase subunit RPC12/RpoP